jgi:peptide/nickel transport system permease protein
MRDYVIKRLLFIIVILFGVSIIAFNVTHIVPNSPEAMWAGPHATKEQLAAAREELRLDEPLHIQYFVYINEIFHGNLGTSIRTRQSVASQLGNFWTATFELVTLSFVIAIVVGIALGVLSAVFRNTVLDHFIRIFSLTGVSIPIFWLGLLLQILFFARLGWLPLQGRISSQVLLEHPIKHVTGLYLFDSLVTGNWPAFIDSFKHILLPAFTLSYAALAMITRQTRSSVLETLGEKHILTAKAYGLSQRVILFKNTLKNALIPVLTVAGLSYGYNLGGCFLVESIFNWPGLGRYGVQSILTYDFPAIMGVVLVFAGSFILVNLIVDLLYAYLDPRIRY